MAESDRRRSVWFSGRVEPDSERVLAESVDRAATVERVSVRFYPGSELDLEISPERVRESDALPLVDYNGRGVIVGDDDHFKFGVSEPLEPGDEVRVTARNTSTQYAYDFAVNVQIDRLGGTDRCVTVNL